MSRGSLLGTGAAGMALLAAAPPPGTALATLAAPHAAADPLAPVLSLLALTAWALLTWLVVVVLATTATRLPGGTGRTAGWLASRLAPAAVRRLVEVALGLTVAAGALGAGPATADTSVPQPPPAVAASLDWPTPPSRPAAPTLDWSLRRQQHPGTASSAPVPVVVQSGDSLWAIAANHLPAGADDAQIAVTWPTWWAANRAAVGADPDLIHPGLSLIPPPQH